MCPVYNALFYRKTYLHLNRQNDNHLNCVIATYYAVCCMRRLIPTAPKNHTLLQVHSMNKRSFTYFPTNFLVSMQFT